MHHYNSTHYCRDSFLYIPLPPDQHHISDVAIEAKKVAILRPSARYQLKLQDEGDGV